MKEIRIDEATGSQRLDKFLQRYLPEAGASFLYRMLRKKNILLNGKKATGREILAPGDEIRIYFSDETVSKFMGDRKDFEEVSSLRSDSGFQEWIVHEDPDVVLVNKPAGILSQKAEEKDISLVEYFRAYLVRKGELDRAGLRLYAPGAVNRLDRNTSGLVICAKTLKAAQILSDAVKTRSVRKYYLALVKGKIREKRDIRGWILRDRTSNRSEVSTEPKEGAEAIETVLVPVAEGKDCTLLSVELITGKTHQIRSHLSFIGHPILGDVKYGDRTVNKKIRGSCGLRRQFLHAERLVFPEMDGTLPEISGRTFRAGLPDDLKKALAQAGIEYDTERECDFET